MGLHPQSTCLISMLLVSLQCVSSFMVYRGTLPPTFRPAQFEKQDERLLSSMLCSDRGLKTELWAQLSNSPEEGDAIFEGDFELKEMSARDASRNLENWIERHFQSQRDAGNDDPRGTYSDPIIILQQMQDWAIAARFRSTKTVKRVLFALDQEDVIQGISCTEVITKEGAGSAEFKVVACAPNPDGALAVAGEPDAARALFAAEFARAAPALQAVFADGGGGGGGSS